MRRISLASPSHVPCHSSPSTHVTPVTKRFDSIVRSTAPVAGSMRWILRSRYWPTQRLPSAQARPESLPLPGAGIEATTSPLAGSILSMRASAICQRCLPSNAVPASPARGSVRSTWPLSRVERDQPGAAGEPHALAVVADAGHLVGAGEGAVLANDLGGSRRCCGGFGGLARSSLRGVIVLLRSAHRCGAGRANLRVRQRSRE